MPKPKGKEAKKPRELTQEDYDELVRNADQATASLFPLRHAARTLREDIGEEEDAVADLEKDILQYVAEMGKRIREREEKLNSLRRRSEKKIREIEAATKKRLKEIEVEKEDIEQRRTQIQGQAEFLRVRLGDYEHSDLLERSQKEKIEELENELNGIREEHKSTVQRMKAEFTRDIRTMRKDYDEKINETNALAKKLVRPCIAERINSMRETNISFAHNMRRISQKQGVLFQRNARIRRETNLLRYEYELWKEIQRLRLMRCDPTIVLERQCSVKPETARDVESVEPEYSSRSRPSREEVPVKQTPYKELRRTLRLLLRPDDSSTESDVAEEEEEEIPGENGSEDDSEEDDKNRKMGTGKNYKTK